MTIARPSLLIHAFIAAKTGMALSGTQRRRLDERLAVLQGSLSEQQYLLHLQTPSGAADLSTLISVVAVHKTDLFRDEVQLSAFRTHVLEPLVGRVLGRPLRVWSAGCATGEEVATLLMMMEEAGADGGSTVLGTDISEVALNRARTLNFPGEQVRRLPGGLRERYFVPDGTRSILVPELRERASFQHHNLMESPYPTAAAGESFDIIFCRNVLIYFTAEAFERVVGLLAERLAPGGTLILSAAEPLLQAPPSLRIIRSENAFFYVRAQEPLAPQGPRSPVISERRWDAGTFDVPRDAANGPGAAPPPGPETRRDSGRFPSVGQEARRDSGRFPTVGQEPRRDSGRFPTVGQEPKRESGQHPTVGPEPRRDSGRFPAVGQEPKRDSGQFPTVGQEPWRDSGRLTPVPLPPAQGGTPESGRYPTVRPSEAQDRLDEHPLHLEADRLFAQVLDGVGEGGPQAEDYLRRCLALDPDLSAARYLLGMMLELRESYGEAAAEYRKALRSLEEGRARSTPFFLNHARLQVACEKAIARMEGGGKAR